ncbi:MAG: F-type H+-transporting ATPase subunit gamma [Acidobacteriota bacterium]|jgi:F-type H+-transporting ATPase subunit gamma|nr:F-type H+-transporting ATPase subunit gamma [Acidobacteriota bacterium]
MPNLLDIRRRIKSVKNTQQITKAMKMLSAAKLKRAQDTVVAARPFANKMTDVLGELASHTDEEFHHPLLDARGDQRYLIVLVTADKGLAGAFNTNLIKATQSFMRQHQDKTIEMIPVGRKGRDFFRRRQVPFVTEYVGLTGKGRIEYSEAVEIARRVIDQFTQDHEIDKVFLIYNEFKSVLQQRVITEQLMPVSRTAETAPDTAIVGPSSRATDMVEYIYEQSPTEIFSRLLPRLIETQIFRALLESVASEHGARMTAMDSASKNAAELIESLTLNMNRVRQAAITSEIIEVVSGATVQ